MFLAATASGVSVLPSEQDIPDSATLHFVDEERDDKRIPAAVLAHALEHLQQAVYVLAADRKGLDIKHRFRKPEFLASEYMVFCEPSISASFGQPVVVRHRQMATHPVSILGGVHQALTAVALRDDKGLADLVSNPQWRRRLLIEVQDLLPEAGSGWSLGFESPGRDIVTLRSDDRLFVSETLAGFTASAQLKSVIGRLVGVRFKEQEFTVEYPLSKRKLAASYRQEFEERILAYRRKLVVVEGDIVISDFGTPERIRSAVSIELVDTSPLQIRRASADGVDLSLEPPIFVAVALDEHDQQYFVGTEPDFGIVEYAGTRAALRREIERHVVFLWMTYLEHPSHPLSPAAKRLADRLKARVANRRASAVKTDRSTD